MKNNYNFFSFCSINIFSQVSTFATFFSRAFDQIRMGAISQTNVNFVGSHCGVSIGEDGPSQMGECVCGCTNIRKQKHYLKKPIWNVFITIQYNLTLFFRLKISCRSRRHCYVPYNPRQYCFLSIRCGQL